MQVAAQGCTVTLDQQRLTTQCGAKKIANGKVFVQRQVWPDKGKTARYRDLQAQVGCGHGA